jgi:hypothetical protein
MPVLLGFTVLLALSGPFIDGFLDALIDVAPWWLLVLLGVWLIFALLGVVSRALIGRGAANEMVGSGGMTGHETWVDEEGRRITPVLRHKTVPYAGLFCIGQQLETQGVCKRVDFLRTFRTC